MGINCNIYLPADVKVRNVFDVMQKVLGAEFIQTSFSNNKNKKELFDGNLPITNDNKWHLEMAKKHEGLNFIEKKDINYLTLNFKDFVDNSYYCLYHTEDDSASVLEPGAKLLNPGSSAVWCVLGKRLVDFFGGKMLYSDAGSEDDPNNWYINENGKFSRHNVTNELNNKWNKFHNLLFNEPRITAQELKDMEEYAPWHDREEKLYEGLKKLEIFESLDKIPEKEINKSNKLKI